MVQLVSLPGPTASADPIPRHGRDGRPKIFPEGSDGSKGEWYTRTTTFIDCLSDKTTLGDWKNRMILEGLARDERLLEEYKALEDPSGADKGKVMSLCRRALDIADSSVKASLGSAIHELTEELDRDGELFSFVPPDLEADMAAFEEATKDLEVLAIEEFAVNDTYKFGGTYDRIYKLPAWICEELEIPVGSLVVGDLKTGNVDLDRGKIAMQLAGYSTMKRYDPFTFERTPLVYGGQEVRTDWGIIVHLPVGQALCRVIPVRLDHEGLELASKVREWRKVNQRKESKLDPLRVVDLTPEDTPA